MAIDKSVKDWIMELLSSIGVTPIAIQEIIEVDIYIDISDTQLRESIYSVEQLICQEFPELEFDFYTWNKPILGIKPND